nr:hypothetical protein [Bacillus sp. Marseille-P3661]
MIQRAVEQEGIPTLSISHLPELTERTNVPRALHIKFPMGSTFGAPGRSDLQRKIVLDMINGVTDIKETGTIQPLPYNWKKD